MKVYHVTSPKKFAKYQKEGRIKGPMSEAQVYLAERLAIRLGKHFHKPPEDFFTIDNVRSVDQQGTMKMFQGGQFKARTHPLRCETCRNREVNPNDDNYCNVIGDFIAGEIEMDTTAKVGCASHTSAPARKQTKAEQESNELAELREAFADLEQKERHLAALREVMKL